ncbi:hypothetical protein [Streptomyces noursei]
MARRYECRDCNEVGAWTSYANARTDQGDHHDSAHGGLRPRHESITSNAQRIDHAKALWFAAALVALWVTKNVLGLI